MKQNSREKVRKGRLVAQILTSSWRETNLSPVAITAAELDEVTPLLYGSGGAGLGWWRLRSSELRDQSSAALLQQAFRLQALQSAIHEQKVEKVFRLLRQASIEAILLKGWAAARMYPDTALRPYGDIDLLVRHNQLDMTERVLSSEEARDCWVDLHTNLTEIADRSLDDLFERTVVVTLNGEHIRILSAEDHLALLAIHMLKHGAWRPVWLCDVSAAIESATPNFSWAICLGRSSKRAGWITSAIGLAHKLLHADISSVPVAQEAMLTPAWLSEGVLKQWANPFAINQPPMSHSAPMGTYLKRPWGILKALRERWPNPILATVSINGEFNELPRLPYQIGNCAVRMGQFVVDLPSRLRN